MLLVSIAVQDLIKSNESE